MAGGTTLETLGIPSVSYAQVRPQVQAGDLLLCSGSSPMSRLIQYATESPWSHVGFCLWLERVDRLVVLESVESIGVRAVALRSYVEDYSGTGRAYPGRLFLARHQAMALQMDALGRLTQHAIDHLGARYDTREILEIALRITAEKLGLAARPPKKDTVFICSEFVADCFAEVGLALPYDPRGFIAPCDFVRCAEVTVLWEILGP